MDYVHEGVPAAVIYSMEGSKNGAGETAVFLMRKVPLEGMELTDIAYADGRLHVQMRTEDMFRNDNHGFLRLADENGRGTDYVYHVSYKEQEGDSFTRYDEFVFAVAEEELADLNLSAHLWVTGNYTEGPWEVTFQLKGQ